MSAEHRVTKHLRKNSIIGKALRKYGVENFNQYIFEGIQEDTLDFVESEMISRLNSISPNGYNLDSGGNKNKHITEDTKRKMSLSKKGYKNPMFKKGYKQVGEKNPMFNKGYLVSGEKHADVNGSKNPRWKGGIGKKYRAKQKLRHRDIV